MAIEILPKANWIKDYRKLPTDTYLDEDHEDDDVLKADGDEKNER